MTQADNHLIDLTLLLLLLAGSWLLLGARRRRRCSLLLSGLSGWLCSRLLKSCLLLSKLL